MSLPAELRARVTRADYVEGDLIIYTESAAWSSRLRFALAEVDEALRRERPALRRLTVRVAPPPRRR